MSQKINIDFRTIIKLTVWSLLVGMALYWLDASPADIYGWIFDKIADFWGWISQSGIQYVLVGASIVVPVYFIDRFMKKRKS